MANSSFVANNYCSDKFSILSSTNARNNKYISLLVYPNIYFLVFVQSLYFDPGSTQKALARSVSIVSGREPSQELLEHRQALSILIRVANARAIFRRDPGSGIVATAPDTSARLALEVYGGP